MTEEKVIIPLPLIQVQVLANPGKSCLVSWVENGQEKRGFIPASKVSDNQVAQKVLDAATPYGVPWSKLLMLHATVEQIEAALHNAGIWTLEDLQSNYPAAIGAVQAGYNLDVSSLAEAARRYQSIERK